MPDITLKESASTPSTPPAGYVRVFVDSSGIWKTVDEAGAVSILGSGFNQEQIEDIIGAMLVDTASVDLTYDDSTGQISAVVLPAGVAHQSLSGAGTNTHAQIDSHISSTSNPHAVTAAQLSDFESEVLATTLTGFSLASTADVTSSDTVISSIGKLQAQLDSVSSGAAFDPANTEEAYDSWISGGTAGSLGWINNSSGTNSTLILGDPNAYIDGGHVGTLRIYTGTTTTGRGAASLGTSTFVLGGGEITIEALVLLPTLSDGTNSYTVYIGSGDQTTSTEHSNGVYFVYSHSLNSGQWMGRTANSATRTTVNSSITVANNTWYKLRIVSDATGSNVEFFVNGVSIGTSSTNLPTGTTKWMGPIYKIVKSAGTSGREILTDYFWFKQVFTTPRG